MFKVKNGDTRTTYFTPCSTVCIVNFEQVNAGWEVYFSIALYIQEKLHIFTNLQWCEKCIYLCQLFL